MRQNAPQARVSAKSGRYYPLTALPVSSKLCRMKGEGMDNRELMSAVERCDELCKSCPRCGGPSPKNGRLTEKGIPEYYCQGCRTTFHIAGQF